MAATEAYTYDGVEEKFVKKAEKELGEKPAQVRAHTASLRRWVQSMPHLECRTDDGFLLRFLRVAKFDQSRAQLMLDNYVTIRKSPKGSPHWFQYPSMDSAPMTEYLKAPMHAYLGHTSDGECVIYSTMKNWDPDQIQFDDMVRCMYMFVDSVLIDQYSQLNGVKVIVDLGQAEKKQMNFIENRKNFFNMMRNWQDAFPMRTRAVVYVNEPRFFDVMFTLIKNAPFLKDKFKKKLHKVGTDYSRMKKILGEADADRLLPKELGGSNGSLDEHRMKMKSTFDDETLHREWRLMREMQVDESKRQASTRDFLRTQDDAADPTTGISGTFTKLNVD